MDNFEFLKAEDGSGR